jgi:hypothetical protein
MGKTKYTGVFEQGMIMVPGAQVCVKNYNAAGFLSTVSCVYQEWPTTHFYILII